MSDVPSLAVCHLCQPPRPMTTQALWLHLWIDHDFLDDPLDAVTVDLTEGPSDE